jgi:hypothetical protein
MGNPMFIIHDTKDKLHHSDNGQIISDGVVGRIGPDNAYLSIYASFPDGSKDLRALDVGDKILGVSFSMSGGHGVYTVIRVA